MKGLPGRKRRDAARACFINASMRPSSHAVLVYVPLISGAAPVAASGRGGRQLAWGYERAVNAGSGVSSWLRAWP